MNIRDSKPDQIVTRAEAKAEGLRHYFTGKPCPHGHVVQRQTCDGGCTACARVRSLKRYNKKSEHCRAKALEWKNANRAQVRAYAREWAKTHPERRAAVQRNRNAIKQRAEGKHFAADIRALLTLQGWRCAECKASVRKIGYHVDHIVPLSRGGANHKYNLQILCSSCNTRKNDRDPLDWARLQGRLL
jgi:5-methylcytosine-specific restriction endonuclease McrA